MALVQAQDENSNFEMARVENSTVLAQVGSIGQAQAQAPAAGRAFEWFPGTNAAALHR